MSTQSQDQSKEHEARAPQESVQDIGLLVWAIAAGAIILLSVVLMAVWLLA